MEKSVIVQVWGKQSVEKKPINTAAKKGKDTKAIMRAETMKRSVSHFLPPIVLAPVESFLQNGVLKFSFFERKKRCFLAFLLTLRMLRT